MWQIDKLVKIGTRELAENFGKDMAGVILEPDRAPHHWINLDCLLPGDAPFNFYIVGKNDFSGYETMNEYMGQVLVRDGHVQFYDRYPVGGGPFEVKDFKSPDFRRRAELIVQNIDQLLGYDGKEAAFDVKKDENVKQARLQEPKKYDV
ncbi:hypothetical protein HZA97_06845 [Candidatus Woesearchaeota archaeon]|nr:hypothetical protein [Candidatus Woesearchaeota archaeon]